jgi:phage/plasmid-associated DNA primase
LISQTLGQYFGILPSEYFTTKKMATGKPEPELYNVLKCRYVVFKEANSGKNQNGQTIYFNSEIAKLLTGRDPIQVRSLYVEPITIVPHFILVGEFNSVPEIQDQTNGSHRRYKNIHFDSKFVPNPNPNRAHEFLIDRDIQKKFSTWRMHFFHILTDYYNIAKQDGIDDPECVIVDSKDMIDGDNIINQWYDIHIIENQNSILTLKEAWDHFNKYYQESGTDSIKPLKKEFKKNLENWISAKVCKSSSLIDNKTGKCKNYQNFWRNYSLK